MGFLIKLIVLAGIGYGVWSMFLRKTVQSVAKPTHGGPPMEEPGTTPPQAEVIERPGTGNNPREF